MAIDVYLWLEGIKGESTDEGHKGWIECQSVHWAMSQPKSATSSTGGGHSAERCEMTDISFIKLSDLATPLLAQSCASGRTLPRAKFEFFRADAAGGRVLYFEIEVGARRFVSDGEPSSCRRDNGYLSKNGSIR